MLIMQSLKRLPAGMVSVIGGVEIILAYMVQVVWFQEPADIASIVGSIVIILSVILVTQQQSIAEVMNKNVSENQLLCADKSEQAGN